MVADPAGSPVSTANRIATVRRQSGKYPQGVIGNSREARLLKYQKTGSGKLKSGKKSDKKADNFNKKWLARRGSTGSRVKQMFGEADLQPHE
ncbi:MAG: hypothetical protein IBX55_22740 [Methyloprofundus sp.]|nr:hypothetical protein [Methyloprofundus sp.]